MKNRLLVVFAVMMLIVQTSIAQDSGEHAVSFKYINVDAYSPYGNIKDGGELSFDFNVKKAFDIMQRGLELNYYYGITDYLSVGVPIKSGIFRQADVTMNDVTIQNPVVEKFVFGSAGIRGKLSGKFMSNQMIVPFASSGIDMMKIGKRDWDMIIPLELGLNLRLSPSFYLTASSEYRWSAEERKDENINTLTNHMMHSIGVTWILNKKKETPPPPPTPEPEPTDTDGDGIVDDKDTCPDVAGLAKFEGCPDTDGDNIQDANDDCPKVAGLAAFNGCPDTDGDGLADNKDECPTEAGSIANKGCPVKVVDRDGDGIEDRADNCPDTPGKASLNGCPDTDGDGITDKRDQCPSTPGIAKFNGCPDTDGDGFPDKNDKCPTTAGTNNGCPEIKQEDKATLNFATQAIEFETGSAIIRATSYAILDQIASIMSKYPNYSMSISGYTDNVGNDNNNLLLSEKRARACKEYLVNKGISITRMNSAGYGETSPVADNGTKEGRQRNRRVEFKIFLK